MAWNVKRVIVILLCSSIQNFKGQLTSMALNPLPPRSD